MPRGAGVIPYAVAVTVVLGGARSWAYPCELQFHGDIAVEFVHTVVGCRHAERDRRLVGGEGDRLWGGAGDVFSLLGHQDIHLEGAGDGVGLAPVAVQGEGGSIAFVYGSLVPLDAHTHESAVVAEADARWGAHLVLGIVAAGSRAIRAIAGL